jgi:hypothetical protein
MSTEELRMREILALERIANYLETISERLTK